ncbi:hypothetical protein SAMN05216486_10164 [bacterium JGI 053]|nr:hypothetical protein SAMN05216486_10164 [bacterium JGI 053]
MSSTDKPALYQGSLSTTQVYTGSDAPNTSGDTASPPNGSLYLQHDPTGASPQSEVGIFEYAPSYTPPGMTGVPAGWRPLMGTEVINVRRFGAIGSGDINLFAWPIAPTTQTVSLAVGSYRVWLVGTGSVTASAGTAVGSGFAAATEAAPITIVITTAGTVSFTRAGVVTRAAVENNAAVDDSPAFQAAFDAAVAQGGGGGCGYRRAPSASGTSWSRTPAGSCGPDLQGPS